VSRPAWNGEFKSNERQNRPLRPCWSGPAFEDCVPLRGHSFRPVTTQAALTGGATAARRNHGQENRHFPIHVSLRQSCSWRAIWFSCRPSPNWSGRFSKVSLRFARRPGYPVSEISHGSMKKLLKDWWCSPRSIPEMA